MMSRFGYARIESVPRTPLSPAAHLRMDIVLRELKRAHPRSIPGDE